MNVMSPSQPQAGRPRMGTRNVHPRKRSRSRQSGRLLVPLAAWVLAFVAIGLLFAHVLAWFQHRIDDMRYGMPRTAHATAYVGHGDERHMPTHIITLNLAGQVSTLVLPGGAAEEVQVLPGPYIVGRDGAYAPAVPWLEDVDGDGHVDLLVTVREETVVYLNRHGQFVFAPPEEQEARQVGQP